MLNTFLHFRDGANVNEILKFTKFRRFFDFASTLLQPSSDLTLKINFRTFAYDLRWQKSSLFYFIYI